MRRQFAPCLNGAHPTSQSHASQAASASGHVPGATLALFRDVHDHPRRHAHARATMWQLARAQRVLKQALSPTPLSVAPIMWEAESGYLRTPQVPTMAEIDFSVAATIFLLFLASLQVCGHGSNPPRTLLATPLLSSYHHFHPWVRALLPAHCPPRPAH